MGWLPQEYAAAGVPYARRGARMDEYLRCLEALWTQDPVEFAGEFYTVPRSHVGPPPVQRPRPPVLVGGTAAPALRRAGRLAQGWIASSQQDLATLAASIETVRAAARAVGREPQIVMRRTLNGTRDEVLEELAQLRAQGVTEVILDLNLSAQTPDVEYAEGVLDAFAPTPLRPSA
jgi:alkanesulfonate monooxygenase SsuD/methylene tetrahydromethanopterin reductase-like flavin-dependent oxidoreductase (luciferase family)